MTITGSKERQILTQWELPREVKMCNLGSNLLRKVDSCNQMTQKTSIKKNGTNLKLLLEWNTILQVGLEGDRICNDRRHRKVLEGKKRARSNHSNAKNSMTSWTTILGSEVIMTLKLEIATKRRRIRRQLLEVAVETPSLS